jgi:hypothetical protein
MAEGDYTSLSEIPDLQSPEREVRKWRCGWTTFDAGGGADMHMSQKKSKMYDKQRLTGFRIINGGDEERGELVSRGG